MRLSRIKIAGFKSFVDPTDLKLPTSLVGIVGPNGCGKSNTIDAVRWVMGESSAKHLRGESMDDVIFTGSSTRKPVAQASVELVFDNADGSLGGEYAQYAEISIKREASRDGGSKYLLNNTRCRRRDIRDIFLGTGLGPRSYAIIEQGMISRLIEAKPEELRVYLEEAAGISKYKERRKETETRIRNTRDNLDRLDDLREEVDKQLAHLQKQAATAERFQKLKAEERKKRGELLGLRRGRYVNTRDEQSLELSKHEAELEGIVAELRAAESAIELAREQQVEATENLSTVQANFYAAGSEVSRLEQKIEHTRESRRQQSQELTQVERSLSEAQAHVTDDTRRIQEMDQTLSEDQPAFEQLKQSQRLSAEMLARAETELSEWRNRNDSFNQRHSDMTRTAQVELSSIDQINRNIANADLRLQRLKEEHETLDVEPLVALIEVSIEEEVEASAEEERYQQMLEQSVEKQQGLRQNVKDNTTQLNQTRSEMQTRLGRLASLEALQQAALEAESHDQDSWLRVNQLDTQPRLAQKITAQPGWEKAVEMVLGSHLEAVCVDGSDILERCLQESPAAQLCLLDQTVNSDISVSTTAESLRSKVQGAIPMDDFMFGVFAVEDAAQALAMRSNLATGESVITPDGLWLGRNWLRVSRAEAQDSVLLREAAISELREELTELEERVQTLEEQGSELALQLSELESRRETQQRSFNDAVRRVSSVKSTLASKRQQQSQQMSRIRQLDGEISEAEQLLEQDKERVQVAHENRMEAVEQLDMMSAEREQLAEEQEALQAALSEARSSAEADRDAGQELAIRVESMRSARVATEQNLTRMTARIEELAERQIRLNELLASDNDDEDPLAALELALEEVLSVRLAVEAELTQARDQAGAIEQHLREHEQARVRHDKRQQQVRDVIQNARIASQEVLVRLKTIDEQLEEHDYDIDTVLADIEEDASVEIWEADLAKIEQRIQRLGSINLAAIDELAEQVTRKEYLDSQYTDVSDALATLESAIAKIDRETRTRFKETFDLVNAKVEEFFPRLFGGGKASLKMTDDDLLSTGVGIMAQPPGKSVRSIQLLSGGEKALTAVALVFAFFELNPSPFCMLDEVDAPLDDANVGRFCELVKEMSDRVQFIFITHNKVTMEMANQLMGVTMNEPGVSRLVAVDVQEAVELAGA